MLIPNDVFGDNEKIFEKRFGLKQKPILLRVRILDQTIADRLFSGLTDVSITEQELKTLDFQCSKVYITENEMNFLSLPNIVDSIAIWGRGYAVNALKNISWLTSKSIIYWGDIDVDGFAILSQLRGYYPHTRSMMMDMDTYNQFKEHSVQNNASNPPQLSNLCDGELEMYDFVKENKIRLEQEKVSHSYSLKFFE